MPMSHEDWKEMKAEFKTLRDAISLKQSKVVCEARHSQDKKVLAQIATNTTDLTWLKRAFWAGFGSLTTLFVTLLTFLLMGVG